MSNHYIEENVDLSKLPKLLVNGNIVFHSQLNVTLGDLHGNALKLLYMLIKHGIATGLNKKDYQAIVEIYAKDELDAADLDLFNSLLGKIEFNNSTAIRLIGDELADRGSNDYFTLKLFEKLNEAKVPLEILLSNHGVDFLLAIDKKNPDFLPELMNPLFSGSMFRLGNLIDKELVSKDEILELANRFYKPCLKALSYTLNKDRTEITIYSHAPIDLNVIKHLAAKVGIQYNDRTVLSLAQTIDAINEEFQDSLKNNNVNKKKLYTKEQLLKSGQEGVEIDPEESPFEFIMWNRDYSKLERPPHFYDYNLCFVHGHDMHDKEADNKTHLYNLDNKLGKGSSTAGQYTVLCSEHFPIGPYRFSLSNLLKIKINGQNPKPIQDLIQTLEFAIENYNENPEAKDTQETFRNTCSQAIHTAHLELNQLEKNEAAGFIKILVKINQWLATLPIFSKPEKKSFHFFRTDFDKKLDILEEQVDTIVACSA